MASPRTLYPQEVDDFESQPEIRCINVSPFTCKLEIGTVPGSRPRRHKLEPGAGVYLQAGYAEPYLTEVGKTVRPIVESLTEREAWPGVRDYDKDDKLVWIRKPGPRLPMVVAESRAAEVKAQWDAALAQRDAADTAPLRMTLQRADGSSVEVQADIERPRAARPVPMEDAEDQAAIGHDEPPPDHDDPLAPVLLPVAEPEAPKGRRGR